MKWSPMIVPSGHFGPVQDLCWNKDYSFFVSVRFSFLFLFHEFFKNFRN